MSVSAVCVCINPFALRMAKTHGALAVLNATGLNALLHVAACKSQICSSLLRDHLSEAATLLGPLNQNIVQMTLY